MQILRNEISTYIILQMLIIQKNYIHQQMSCYKLMGGLAFTFDGKVSSVSANLALHFLGEIYLAIFIYDLFISVACKMK